LGTNTAVNTCLAAIDKIRDTADAHERVFSSKYDGRDTGDFAAFRFSDSRCAEMAILPEENTDIEDIIKAFGNTEPVFQSLRTLMYCSGR